jgi:hypothetical protein
MEQRPPWEADSRPCSQEISHLLWNPKFHYRGHKSLSPVPILIQINPIHTLLIYFHPFNIVFPSMPRSYELSLPFRLSKQNYVRLCGSHLPHAYHMPRPFYPYSGHSNNIWWRVQIMKFLIMKFSPVSSLFIPLRSNILLSVLFLNTLKLFSSFSAKNHVSHPYKTKAKYVVLCTWIFGFLGRSRKTEDFGISSWMQL